MKHITKKEFNATTLPLPPLPEQKAIAHILSTVQCAKEATEQVIQATKELKKSLMKHLFTYGAVSLEEAPNVKLKETDIGMVPEEWEVVSIGELLDNVIIQELQDGNHGKKHPKQKDFTNTGVPFITANCIRYSKILFEDAKFLDEKWLKKLRIGFARPNDVLLTHKGTIGESAILGDSHQVVILSPQVTYYRIKDTSKLSPLYLLIAFQSESFISQLKAHASTQSTRAYVGIKKQGTVLVPFPSPSIQKLIQETIGPVNTKIEQEENRLRALDQLFKTLLNNLMTGKIRVKNFEVPEA